MMTDGRRYDWQEQDSKGLGVPYLTKIFPVSSFDEALQKASAISRVVANHQIEQQCHLTITISMLQVHLFPDYAGGAPNTAALRQVAKEADQAVAPIDAQLHKSFEATMRRIL